MVSWYTVVWTRHHEYGVLDGYSVTGCGYSVTNLTHGVTRADPYSFSGTSDPTFAVTGYLWGTQSHRLIIHTFHAISHLCGDIINPLMLTSTVHSSCRGPRHLRYSIPSYVLLVT